MKKPCSWKIFADARLVTKFMEILYHENFGTIGNVMLYGHSQQQANNQPYKNGKMPCLGSQPGSILTFQGLRFYQCHHLVSCPKSLSDWPRLEVLAFGPLTKWQHWLSVRVSPGRQWWTRVRIPEKTFLPCLELIVIWLLAVTIKGITFMYFHIHNLQGVCCCKRLHY